MLYTKLSTVNTMIRCKKSAGYSVSVSYFLLINNWDDIQRIWILENSLEQFEMPSTIMFAATAETIQRKFDFILKKRHNCNINKLFIKPLQLIQPI